MNDWFSVNVVGDITPKVKESASSRGPIESRKIENSERKNVNRILTVRAPTQAKEISELVVKSTERETMESNNELSTSNISNVFIQANAENDPTIQKVINLVRNRNNAIIACLPPLGGKSLIPFQLAKTEDFTWTIV